ncbi:MAG: ribosomal protein S18-alanine N-acetyltransferase [Oscillospiraceae bacterium]
MSEHKGCPELVVRQMDAETLPAVAAIEAACFSIPWSLESLEHEIDNPRSLFLVALAEDVVAGYLGMHHVLDQGDIDNVAMLPEYRGRGIAKALIRELILQSARLGLSFLMLEVRPGNGPAVGLYQSFGFREVGRRKNYYEKPREDALLMRLDLGEGDTEEVIL